MNNNTGRNDMQDGGGAFLPRLDDRGAALVTALVFLVLLTALGLASIMTSSTEVLISRNDRLNKLAVDHANAGVQMVLAALDVNSIGYNHMAYDLKYNGALAADRDYGRDTGWSLSSGSYPEISDINFSAVIKYKEEDNLHVVPDAPAPAYIHDVVGYCKDLGYGKSTIQTFERSFPVYQIVSTGNVMQGTNVVATASVTTELTKNTLNISAPGGLFSASCPTFSGSSIEINGASDAAIVTNGAACDPADYGPNTWDHITGASLAEGNADIDMDDYLGMPVAEIANIANNPLNWDNETRTGDVLGTNPGNPLITYINNGVGAAHAVTLNNCSGYGVLIVKGDLTLGGSFTFDGLVYVMGDLIMSGGGGGMNITGGIMAEGNTQAADLGGNIKIDFDQAMLDGIAQAAFKSKIINWQRNYAY